MTTPNKLTADLNVENFNQTETQLENQAERLNKLMEINKKLINFSLEFNSINNAANNVDYKFDSKKQELKTEKVETIADKIDKQKSESNIEEKIVDDNTQEKESTKKNESTVDLSNILWTKKEVVKSTEYKPNDEDKSIWEQLLKEVKKSKQDDEELLKAKSLINEANKIDEENKAANNEDYTPKDNKKTWTDGPKIDISNIL